MSAPQFTPRPWGYERREGGWMITYALGLEHGPKSLGLVFDYASEFEEANARLIAAAPELFNGCNALLGLIHLIRGRTDLPSDLQLAIDDDNHRIAEAIQAVAKAQGHD